MNNGQIMAVSVAGKGELQQAVIQEQALFVIARQFPRDEERALEKILESCSRVGLAEEALYSYPRGTTTVEGPSIRLAETIMQRWGNLDSGFKILNQDADQSEVVTWCLDRETGSRDSKSFVVKHIRETRSGNYKITGDRDIYELVSNMAARRKRSCILAQIPVDVIEQAIEQCKKTLAYAQDKPFAERIKLMLGLFEEGYGVTRAQIEKRYGKRAEALTEHQMVSLRSIYKTLKDGAGGVGDFFESGAPNVDVEEVKEVKKQAEPTPSATTDGAANVKGESEPAKTAETTAPAEKTKRSHKAKEKKEDQSQPSANTETAPPSSTTPASTVDQKVAQELPQLNFEFGS